MGHVRRGRGNRRKRGKPATSVMGPKVLREQVTKMVRLHRERQPCPLGWKIRIEVGYVRPFKPLNTWD